MKNILPILALTLLLTACSTPSTVREQLTQQSENKTTMQISMSELSTHNNTQDCWVGFKGEVYDVTKFLPMHPGGISAIGRYCGTASDFENGFDRKHGTNVDTYIHKYAQPLGKLNG